MATEYGRKSRLQILLLMSILSLLLLTPFTVYYLWSSPNLYNKRLLFAPGPLLGMNCNTSQSCLSCPKNVNATVIYSKGGHINLTRCPLEQPFTVFVYKQDTFPVRYTTDVTDIVDVLISTNSWTAISSKACLFLCTIGPLSNNVTTESIDSRLLSLPHWNNGVNHILVDIPEPGHISSVVTNYGFAIVANGVSLNHHDIKLDFTHILTPPVPYSPTTLESSPLYDQLSRSDMLYFEGESIVGVSNAWLNVSTLFELKFNVKFTCKRTGGIINGFEGEWGLCVDQEQRLKNCANSKFSLVLGLGAIHTSSVTYARLTDALRCGSVPVIVGIKQLPFDNVINWNKAAIIIPTLLPPHNLKAVLAGFQPEIIMEYRRQGRFLHETYFTSRKAVMNTIIAILRSRFMHPPTPAPDFSGKVFKVNDDRPKVQASPRFLNNFSIYSESLWNNPPGPFYMYPVTPYRLPYIPRMFNEPANKSPDNFKPPVLKGDDFRSSLHGIHPSEGLTVVALTYHRSKHLAEFVKGFEGCSFLAKIVIVWNDENEPDSNFKLPNIGVPIEVVTTGRNSLNNRFLPFSNIETEAILTIDDDQKIPLGEIQLAFRVWRENRDRIVGWYDRFVYWDPKKRLWYYSWDVSCEPCLALTGAALYHKYYNYLYSYWMPRSIRDVIDLSMNGEDLAMNFLIAYISRKPPMKIDSKTSLHGCSNCGSSISRQSQHLSHRSKCINEFVRIWGHNSLLGTQFRTEPALDGQCLTDM